MIITPTYTYPIPLIFTYDVSQGNTATLFDLNWISSPLICSPLIYNMYLLGTTLMPDPIF
jgi:hypothetical protein